MKNYIILAETGADIPDELACQYGIYRVPMHVTFGTETRDDGTFPVEDVFNSYTASGILPRTSGCNVADFERILDRIHTEHPESHILYLAYSAVTTCGYQSALIASENRDYITLFDTKQVSAGQCLVAVQTARYLEKNPDAELSDVIKKMEEYRSRCHMVFFPGDMEYLKAGGRVSNAAFLAAKLLSLNPLIEIVEGRLVGTKKYRGTMDKAAKKLLSEFTERYRFSKELLYLPFSYGLSEKTKKDIFQQARDMGFQEIRWIQTGSVVSSHSGPGAFGVCGLTD